MDEKHRPFNIDALMELAAFAISEEERQVLEKELRDFLQYAEIIKSAAVDGVSPAAQVMDREPLLAEDKCGESVGRDSVLANAPALYHSSYLVPPQEQRRRKNTTGESAPLHPPDSREYEAVIGLEVHAQLNTKTKLFCRCSTDFDSPPNHNTCPVCAGHPGTLPVLNRAAITMALAAGMALQCTINKKSVFARKNYFYPDLPKGYQISQFEEPLCTGGLLKIDLRGSRRAIRLNRIHIEEDAGKLVHVGAPGLWGAKASAVDLNRAGIPLLEIVSEPELRSPEEAKEYMIMLRAVLVGLGICDGNMEQGSLRCDANVSVRPRGEDTLGVKVEIKNMNSFKAVERALAHEIQRQIKLRRIGAPIRQESRLWDEASQKTHLMRTKEESHDYRYFPEPDLVPLIVNQVWIDEASKHLTSPPLERFAHYQQAYSFTPQEARFFMIHPHFARFYEAILTHYPHPRKLANWFFSQLLAHLDKNSTHISLHASDVAAFLNAVDQGKVARTIAKDILRDACHSGKSLMTLVQKAGKAQISDTQELEPLVLTVIEENPKVVAQFKAGKTKVIGFFIGQVMRRTHGQADPQLVKDLLKVHLERD